MSGSRQVPFGARACPYCGMATQVPHETQEGCIAALHEEIGRTKTILAGLKPAARHDPPEEEDHQQPSLRVAIRDRRYA